MSDMNGTATGTIALETDYLVIGAGASGMTFVDEVMRHDSTVNFVIVDKLSSPGGHWNNAYPFVTLHQGSYYYGVNSEVMERDPTVIDLSSKNEMLAYYEKVMRKFIDTGRVQFLPQSLYVGKMEDSEVDKHEVKSVILSHVTHHVTVRKKLVNACDLQIQVPSTHVPSYKIDDDMKENCVPINNLAFLKSSYEEFVVIGNGKTGIDAVLYLLQQGVPPSKIKWVVSRELWWFDRAWFGPSTAQDFIIEIGNALAEEEDTVAIFTRLQKRGILMTMTNPDDADFELPKLFRCATITKAERDVVQGIKEFVRLGHVTRISKDKIEFGDRGTIPTSQNTLHVDCTANGLPRQDKKQIFFDEKTIVLQPTILCNVTWSTAIIAMVEVLEGSNEDNKRSIVKTIPHPESMDDWVAAIFSTFQNFATLSTKYRKEVFAMRLNMFNHGPLLSTLYKEKVLFNPILPKVVEKAGVYLESYDKNNQ